MDTVQVRRVRPGGSLRRERKECLIILDRRRLPLAPEPVDDSVNPSQAVDLNELIRIIEHEKLQQEARADGLRLLFVRKRNAELHIIALI